MSRSKKWRLEWAFFLGENGRRQYNKLCKGLCPSLQAEFPGGGVVLSALSFPPFQKVRELGFKMAKKQPVAAFPCRGSMISHVERQGVSA